MTRKLRYLASHAPTNALRLISTLEQPRDAFQVQIWQRAEFQSRIRDESGTIAILSKKAALIADEGSLPESVGALSFRVAR